MVAVPFARFGRFEPVTMWYQVRSADLHCVTFIDTDEGIRGVATQGDQYSIMNEARPKLLGKDPFDIEAIEAGLGGAIRGRWELKQDTMAGIDNALWDIVGKACGKPLYKLWGGRVNDPVHVRYWLDCRSPEEQAAEALRAVERGWKALKVKLGTDPVVDLERVRAIREAVGSKIELCFDINGGYPLSVAVNTLRKMMRYEPASIEDPVPGNWPYDPGCLDSMADIRRIVGVPVECHSHGPNCEELIMEVVRRRAADAVHLNVAFTGGVLELRRLCAIAEAGGLNVTGQSSAAELGPRNALMLHLITSERAFRGTNDNSSHFLEPPSGDIIKEEFRTVNGMLRAPEGPGLGVEADPAKLEKYHRLYVEGKYVNTGGLGRDNPYLWW